MFTSLALSSLLRFAVWRTPIGDIAYYFGLDSDWVVRYEWDTSDLSVVGFTKQIKRHHSNKYGSWLELVDFLKWWKENRRAKRCAPFLFTHLWSF